MQVKIYRRVYLTPFIRINFYTAGISISFGHARIGWLTIGRRGVTGTLDTPIPGVYLSEHQSYQELSKRLPRR